MERAKSVLTLDVGNTRVGMGCVMERQSSLGRRVSADEMGGLGDALVEVWDQMPSPKTVAACSVCPPVLEAVENAVLTRLNREVLLVGRELPLPIDTDLPHPEKIGTDRLCAAAMAYFRLETACVVADFGTAIT
ncbi:MAG TPA: type III pantothenate kinase, partial [Phycisphaerae bacterium]|nr:type III pantothenate kinase [Phycisphaerae bacterium]